MSVPFAPPGGVLTCLAVVVFQRLGPAPCINTLEIRDPYLVIWAGQSGRKGRRGQERPRSLEGPRGAAPAAQALQDSPGSGGQGWATACPGLWGPSRPALPIAEPFPREVKGRGPGRLPVASVTLRSQTGQEDGSWKVAQPR